MSTVKMSGMGTEMMHGQQYSQTPGGREEFRSSYPPPGPYPGPSSQLSEQEAAAFISVKPQKDIHRFAGLGVGLAGICAEHILSHPCIVLRRQCQVHPTALWSHNTPFTLIPVIFNIQRNQSLSTMWKGIGSTLTTKGLLVASEAAISEFTPLPKEVNRHSSMKKLLEHLLLKGLSLVIVTPFYAASLVETVQSEIASERPGVFDCLREGTNRLLGWSTSQTTRLLPVWKLFLPSVLHGLGHYIITSLAHYSVLVSMKSELQETKDLTSENPEHNMYEAHYNELIATFTGNLLADIMLYPLETVLHRLCLQGTRTIIDNTDTGLGVMPIITRYEGMYDCFCSILREEGILGFYKGFGALVLQYGLHMAVIKLANFVFEQLAHKFPKQPSSAKLASERARKLQQQRAPGSEARGYPTNYYSPPSYSPYHTQGMSPQYQLPMDQQGQFSPAHHSRNEHTAL